jgi:hypothetical protein
LQCLESLCDLEHPDHIWYNRPSESFLPKGYMNNGMFSVNMCIIFLNIHYLSTEFKIEDMNWKRFSIVNSLEYLGYEVVYNQHILKKFSIMESWLFDSLGSWDALLYLARASSRILHCNDLLANSTWDRVMFSNSTHDLVMVGYTDLDIYRRSRGIRSMTYFR